MSGAKLGDVTEDGSPSIWHAAYCSGGRELVARDGLRRAGFEVFLPFERVKRRRVTRRCPEGFLETVELPVFPNYLFVRTREFLMVERTMGVLSMVKCLGSPLTIPDRVMCRLREATDAAGLMASKDISKIVFDFKGKEGDQFSFKRETPLYGLVGRIASVAALDDTGQISAWVDMFGATRRVDVPYTAVGRIMSKGEQLAAA